MLFLRDYPNARNAFCNRYLPNPTVCYGQEMDVDVVIKIMFISQGSPIVALKPSVDRILVKNWVLDAPFHLIPDQRLPSTGVNHKVHSSGKLLSSYRIIDGCSITTEIHSAYIHSFVDLGPEFVRMV